MAYISKQDHQREDRLLDINRIVITICTFVTGLIIYCNKWKYIYAYCDAPMQPNCVAAFEQERYE